MRHRIALAATLSALVVLTAIWVFWARSLADGVAADVERAGNVDVDALLTGGDGELESLTAEIEAVKPRVVTLKVALVPARVGSALFGWVPYAGDSLRAVADTPRRIDHSLEAAIGLARGASSLAAIQGLVQDGGFGDALNNELELRSQIVAAAEELDAAHSHTVEAQQLGARVRIHRLLWPVRGRVERLGEEEAKLGGYVRWSRAATHMISHSLGALDTVRTLQPALDSQDILASNDLDQLEQAIIGLQHSASQAGDWAAEMEESTPADLSGRELVQDLAEAGEYAKALDRLAYGLHTAITTLKPALDAIRDAEGPMMQNGDAILAAAHQIDSRGDELRDAADALEAAAEFLAKIEGGTPGVDPASVDRVERTATRIAAGIRVAADLSQLAPSLLAENGYRRYLILGQTADELRAIGGFTSSSWLAEFQDGALLDVTYFSNSVVDNLDRLGELPPPPVPLRIHMNAGAWYLRDVGWDPHFPTVASSAAHLFEVGQGVSVDGVIAVDQWALVKLVDALGAIETEDGRITGDQVMHAVEQGTDRFGVPYLRVVLDGLLNSLTGEVVGSRAFEVLSALDDIIHSKNMLLSLDDPDAQDVLRRLRIDGHMPIEEADRVAVIDSNIGWNKSDRNIVRAMEYQVDLEAEGFSTAQLTLTYTNNSVAGENGCDVQSPPRDHSPSYSELLNACHWNFLRAYVAPGSQLVDWERLPLPEGSTAARLGYLQAGIDTVNRDSDLNGTFFSGFLNVPEGGTNSATFTYRLPTTVTERNGTQMRYELQLLSQPGTFGRDAHIKIRLPEGYGYVSGSREPDAVSGNVLEYRFMLDTDMDLTVNMAPVS